MQKRRSVSDAFACLARFRTGLLGTALVLAAATPVRADVPVLPALVAPPSQAHHVGKMIFTQLVTPDLAAAEHFYGALFGWTFQNTQLGTHPFGAASLDGHVVAGIVQHSLPADDRRRSSWLTFLSVTDAEAASDAAVRDGAKLLFGPRSVADLGTEAVLSDPQGAVFAILASSSGDPQDFLAESGEWIWSSLLTADPVKDAGFYRSLFGYKLFDVPGESAGHVILAAETYARASVNPLPASRPDARPRWLNYVRVDDAAAATAKVQALGGHVLVSPRPDRQGGMIAVVSDPMGAAFGLLEWAQDTNAGDAQ